MKPGIKKELEKKDDSLYGLLSLYKQYNTYVRVFVSEENDSVSVWLADNPSRWSSVSQEEYKPYHELRRLEIGVAKLSTKYVSPSHILKVKGPFLGVRIPADRLRIYNRLEDEGYYIIETSVKYKAKLLQSIKRILNLSPSKKYEILEKCVADDQE